jgi:hypothetical protein
MLEPGATLILFNQLRAKQCYADCMAISSTTAKIATRAEAIALLQAVEQSHARDHARVMSGELKASDLHLIPATVARASVIRLSAASIRTRG